MITAQFFSDAISLNEFASIPNTSSYQSKYWLELISNLSRMAICRPTRANINTSISDVALQASCDVCTNFRGIQKRRQIAQPWMLVITLFYAGVTIYYITWARGVAMGREADGAGRDCGSSLTIMADRWQNAEQYRDCLEELSRAVPRCCPPGILDGETRERLRVLTDKVAESGIHRHTEKMLREMCIDPTGYEMEL